jgi:hypothetical protein
MDSHNDLLGELAADAALERSDFIVQSTEQLRRFLDHHKDRIAVLGGLTLIDDEPDYLSIAPDLTFRSRSRYLDDITGEWVSETEVIESASELIELYNPADIYAAFAEAAREAAGLPAEPTAEGDLLDTAGIAPDEAVSQGEDPYAAAADSWAAGQPISLSEDDDESAARRLYDLALEFQERSQRSEARLLDEFEGASSGLVSVIGDLIIVDDDDERLSLTVNGFRAEVIPEDSEEEWRPLSGSEQLVEFYDPTDVFGDLADALAEAFPAVAPELSGEAAAGASGDEAGGLGIAGVRMLADEAIRDGRQVTLLFGTASARGVYPSSLLPDEVEYIVATDDGSLGHHGPVTDLVRDYEAWADQAFACGPAPMLATLAGLAAGRRDRLGVAKLGRKRGAGRVDPVGSPAARRKAFLQVLVEQEIGCAVGACLGCVVMGSSGVPQRACREGPVFAAEELDWESRW